MTRKERQRQQLTAEPPVAVTPESVPANPDPSSYEARLLAAVWALGTKTHKKLGQKTGATAGEPKRERSPEIELLLKALRIAGSSRKLAEWIQTPVPALNGHPPYALMQSEEGRKQVEAVLGRIEHGVY
jgi:uncharacterized protein (DUF2384 family)